jgi:fructokinase
MIVVGLGEILWDCFPDERRPGGAPANVAFHARQLGFRGVLCSRVGTDELGNEFLEFAKSRGLATDWVQRDPQHVTGRATVTLGKDGQAKFEFAEDAAWDHLQLDERAARLVHGARAICFGTLAQRSEDSRKAIHELLEQESADCFIVYDVNLRQKFYERSWIEASLRRAKAVKLNEDEIKILADVLELPSAADDFALAVIDRYRVHNVCVTRGSEGCYVQGVNESVDVAGSPVKVVDTVGAGDAFTAAFIAGHLWHWPLRTTVEFANRVGGLVAGQPGAMPDLADEFAKLREEYGGQA